jgi:aryl-alcohol dehydrogenase-like predicted oxidoreductase
MEYRTLGSTGIDVSALCFGTWRFANETGGVVETDRSTAHDLLDTCAEHGINFIDTANVYGQPSGASEGWIGDWLSGRDRDDYVIASKVYFGFDDGPNGSGLGRKHVRQQIEGTLDRLGTDYLDVYYIHRWDDDTPADTLMRTLNDLVREGKVHHLAASAMAAWKLTRALWQSDVQGLDRFEVTQPRFNAAFRERPADYLDVCADQGLAVCPYSPLEGGFLTGKYERDAAPPEGSRADLQDGLGDYEERQWRVLDTIRSVADEVGVTPAQVSLRWLIDRERFTCVPIVGARTPDQLTENAGAVDVDLTDDQRTRITEAYADG